MTVFVLFDVAEIGLWKGSGPGANGKLEEKGLTAGKPVLVADMAGNENAIGGCTDSEAGFAADP